MACRFDADGGVLQGVSRIRLVLPVADSAPGIIAAISNEDGTENSAANAGAARFGGYLLRHRRRRDRPRRVISGRASQPPYAQPVLPVTLKIGGNPCEIVYAASAPGLDRSVQINARVPDGFVPTGILSVVLTVGSPAVSPA